MKSSGEYTEQYSNSGITHSCRLNIYSLDYFLPTLQQPLQICHNRAAWRWAQCHVIGYKTLYFAWMNYRFICRILKHSSHRFASILVTVCHVFLGALLVGWCSPDAWLCRLNLIRYEFVSILVKLDRMDGEHSKEPHTCIQKNHRNMFKYFYVFKLPIRDFDYEVFLYIRKWKMSVIFNLWTFSQIYSLYR